MYRVAIFLEANLALSALSSESLLRTKPSPLHSGHIPEPPQASQIFIGTSAASEALVLLTRMVAAVPTTAAAIAIEAAVSGRAADTRDGLLLCSCSFTLTEEQKLGSSH